MLLLSKEQCSDEKNTTGSVLFLLDGTEIQCGINQHSCVGIKKLI